MNICLILIVYFFSLFSRTSKLKIGNPFNLDTDVGALISPEHLDRVMEYIRIGKEDDGAHLLCGGERLHINIDDYHPTITPPPSSNGSFMSPAIFTECNDDMRIVQEEIFGKENCYINSIIFCTSIRDCLF